MTVKHEIKSQLAKLLATEDIIVEHKQVDTAQFNVHTRVLTLPMWERASSNVMDMLVGHEVGHALFTPDVDPPSDIPHQFVNVVEDARIEKLMKRKYMGLAKSFYKGYNELHEEDFFELDGEDITNFNLADRANLYFKLGSRLDLVFSSTEEQIINIIDKCETYADVKKAALILYEYCREQQNQEQEKSHNHSSNVKPPGNEVNEVLDEIPEQSEESNPPISEVSSEEKLEVKTVDTLSEKLQELVNDKGIENVYVEVPEINLENIIINNQEVHKEIDNDWVVQQQLWREKSKELGYNIDLGFSEVDDEFYKFKHDAKREVSYLVKEFECRKSASAYARASTSKTGVLDTNQLQTYRFNEDLFKKVTVLPDGKNHGLVFILDWSGSMQYVLKDTLKQLYNLIWFCRKVQIPFEVYAFTTEWDRDVEAIRYEEEECLLHIDRNFSLMNIFSSKVNAKTLENQMINIWRIAASFAGRDGYRLHYGWPQRLVLSGTPLNESLIALHQILPKFQNENNLEKVQCIILTDGEANVLPYRVTINRRWEDEPFLGCRNINPHHCFLRDRKLGKTYRIDFGYHKFTEVLINNLKDRFPFTNFIGIRVLGKRDASQFMRMYNADEKVYSDWRKNKSFTITNSGYDAYFGLSSTALAQDADFDVDSSATKGEIKRAFVKSLKTKKLKKKVLGEFIELVA